MLTSCQDVDAICQPLKQTSSPDFCYMHIDTNGHFFELSNDAESQAFLFTHTNYLINTSHINAYCYQQQNSGFTLTDLLVQDEFLKNYRERFQFYHGLNYFRKSRNQLEIFQFTTPNKEPGILNYYMNHLDVYESFADHFIDKARPLIAEGKKHAFQSQHKPPFNRQTKNRLEFTQREMQILRYNAQFKTAKQIAKTLHLSVRTVENYLYRLKAKCGTNTKNELARKTLIEGLA